MEIRTQSTFQLITWVIRDFWELPQENEFFVDSPEFLYRGDPYSIRLYPKMNGDKTAFHVRRLSGNFPEREVSCILGLKRRLPSGDKRYVYCRRSLQQNLCYSRFMIERDRDKVVPNGSLTIVCIMSGAGSSAQGEEEQGGFLGHIASFSSRQSPAKMELTTQFPCTRVRLTVPNVFQLLRESSDSLTSPEFRFAGDTYCLRFEANGDRGDTDLRLVRLTSTFTVNAVFYKVGYGYYISATTYWDNSRPLVGNVGFCVSFSTLEKDRNNYFRHGHLYLWLLLHLGEQSSVQKETGLTDVTTSTKTLSSEISRVPPSISTYESAVKYDSFEFLIHFFGI